MWAFCFCGLIAEMVAIECAINDRGMRKLVLGYRCRWRNVTLTNSTRPSRDFDIQEEALQFLVLCGFIVPTLLNPIRVTQLQAYV